MQVDRKDITEHYSVLILLLLYAHTKPWDYIETLTRQQ